MPLGIPDNIGLTPFPVQPFLTFGGSGAGIVYGQQKGMYNKDVGIIAFTIYLLLTAKGVQAGAAVIGGLPFLAANIVNVFSSLSVIPAAMAATINSIPGAYIVPGTSNITLSTIVAGNYVPLDNTHFTGNTGLIISGEYNIF